MSDVFFYRPSPNHVVTFKLIGVLLIIAYVFRVDQLRTMQ
jgi:hypothetical protein